MKYRILVVDDDIEFRKLVVEILMAAGYQVLAAESAETALEVLSTEAVDLVLTDQRMPGLSGLELARRVRSGSKPPEIVVMTAYGTIPQAVEAVQAGAADYLMKPLESPRALRELVQRILDSRAPAAGGGNEFITRDAAVLEVLALADRAAATDATVLIVGESGTGKEILAQRIHEKSRRKEKPFVAVNCAAIPEHLAESEFFGHERGAFTGADRRRQGRFEQAHQGTLFLDEVGELAEPLQAKLLRVLEERVVERLGGSEAVRVDLRLLAATNRDLEISVARGGFRKDLFYRLNVVTLELPPLRERPGDLVLLGQHLVKNIAERLGVSPRPISDEALQVLKDYRWPGNVRELRNVLERALISGMGEEILLGDLSKSLRVPEAGEMNALDFESSPNVFSMEQRERRAILEALSRCDGHRERAARLLGISVRTLYNRLKEYGVR